MFGPLGAGEEEIDSGRLRLFPPPPPWRGTSEGLKGSEVEGVKGVPPEVEGVDIENVGRADDFGPDAVTGASLSRLYPLETVLPVDAALPLVLALADDVVVAVPG